MNKFRILGVIAIIAIIANFFERPAAFQTGQHRLQPFLCGVVVPHDSSSCFSLGVSFMIRLYPSQSRMRRIAVNSLFLYLSLF